MDPAIGLKINDVAADGQGRLVLVINCKCVLPHGTAEKYAASHANGCLMRPSEGLVMTTDGYRVTGWGPADVFNLYLFPVTPEKAADVKRQMADILDAACRTARGKRRPRD